MKRHPIDAISLVFGLIFLAVGSVFVAGEVDAADLGTGWIVPGVLVAAGFVIGAVAWHRRPQAAVDAPGIPATPEPETEPEPEG